MRLKFLWSLLLLASSLNMNVLQQRVTEDLEGVCSLDTFRCKTAFSPDGRHCVPKNWVCDGDKDCPDGDDEVGCGNRTGCPDNQFHCPVGVTWCIYKGWLCDGQNDCENGADEAPEICRTRKKGSFTRVVSGAGTEGLPFLPASLHNTITNLLPEGDLVDQFQCLPNTYRCPGSYNCINFTNLCDGHWDCLEDGADEGGHCLNKACRNNGNNCMCKETMQGAQCYCEQSKVYNVSSKQCVDIDECLYDAYCDQDCVNHDPGYECTCRDGYVKSVEKGQRSYSRCMVDPEKPAPKLILANHTLIQLLDLQEDTKLNPPFHVTPSSSVITAVDFDYASNSICWVSYGAPLTCANASNSSQKHNISMQFSLDFVKQVAKDWVSGNWYFTDEVREQIFVCTADGQHCMTVIHNSISRPKSLALDPTNGYMFYTDWSTSARIGRADLDGENQVLDLVNKKIVHPHGITLDFVKKQLYWGDSFLDFIERINYDGSHRVTIAHRLNVLNLFSMSLLENDLYVINHHNHSIVRIHRFDPMRHAELVANTAGNPSVIKVFHYVRQPPMSGDICGKKNCSHFCIPVPSNRTVIAKCVCRPGFKLFNSTQCHSFNSSSYLLYANAQLGMIRSVSLQSGDVGDPHEPIINLVRPVAVAVDPRNNDIYYSDINKRQIGRYNLKTKEATELRPGGSSTSSCEGLAVDWLGNNLYWTDSSFSCIFVASLNDPSLVQKVVCDNLTHPKSIVLDPPNGRMYWTDWVMQPSTKKAKIESAKMDGSDRRVLNDSEVQWPNSLCLDVQNGRLYWTEAYYDRIQSMNITGGNVKKEVNREHLDHPYGIVYHEGMLYWTEAIKGEILRWNLTSKTAAILRNDSKLLFDMVLVTSRLLQPDDHPCFSKNCSDLCLPTGKNEAVCRCALNRQQNGSESVCSGTVEALKCAEEQFTCVSDGTCIPTSYKCDNIPNCADGSDEADCDNFTCGEGMHKCDGTHRCIFQQFVCDGESDCLNGSDESESICSGMKCPVNHTKCANSSRCILDGWFCDGEIDCPYGSDEGTAANCTYSGCPNGTFQCIKDGRCLPIDYRCDHEYDCQDHSDENGCNQGCDLQTEIRCKNSAVCLPGIYLCNGVKNCPDGSDEQGCLVNQQGIFCSEEEFRCLSNVSCIPQSAVCDGTDDCADNSDEQDCATVGPASGRNITTCHWSEFLCSDHSRCIPSVWKCDRDNDCSDRSDEKNCSYNQQCKEPFFQCKNASDHCLSPEQLCDGKSDCPDHSDEGRLCYYDMCVNHDCSDKCHTSPDGFVCSCYENRRLRNDTKTCDDINVCEQWGACSQNCAHSPAGKLCSCLPGYELALDKWSCKAIAGDPVMVIFSRRHEIRQLNMNDMSTVSLVSGLRNTIALDFLWDEKYLFWTDVGDDKIYRGTILSNTVTDIQRIIDVGLATTEGVAVDWVGGNIYWVESNLDQIEVAKLNGTDRTTLLAGDMHSPRAIVLDPRVGLLFWTDWNQENPRIERCTMSGEQRIVIYNITSLHSAGWPNGLSIDYDMERLYWVDARSDSVHSTTYEGTDHRLILISHDLLSHPFSVTLFEDYVYWTDWRFNTLVKANKFDGSNVTVIQRTYTQPFDVKIFHPLRQPKVKNNPCDPKTNGGCSHLCLLGNDKGRLVAVCRCPHRWKLQSDNKTCIGDNTFLLYVKHNEIRGVDLKTAHYNVIPSITVPFVENASAIDYDVKSDRLYWTDSKRQVISSAFLNGTGVQTIIDIGLSNPEGFAIDWLSRNMYFTSSDEEKASISVAKLDGAFRTEIVTQDKKFKLNSIVVHPQKGVMFWSEVGENNHRIMRAYMDGSNKSEFVSNATNAASLTLDLEDNKLYWVSRVKTPKVYYCLVNVSTCQKIRSLRQDISDPFSITIYHRTAYYASSTKIRTIDLQSDNTSGKDLRTDTPHVLALQVYDPALRNGSNNCSRNNGGCQQLCLPHREGHHCRCTAGFTLSDDSKTCKGMTSFLLYSTATEIHGISLDATDKKEALAPISKISLAASVSFYAEEDQIYWVDTTARTISHINRDLSERQTIVWDGISGVESVVVDWISGNIYWTDRGIDVIKVARLNGSNPYVIIEDDMEKPRSIAIHPAQGHLFFSDWGTYPRIVKAQLDGSGRSDFVIPSAESDGSPNPGIKAPYGIAIDYEENMLYWCDKVLNIIERVNISSPQDRQVIISSNLTDCVSLDVFGNYIYWADLTDLNGSIKRANKKDGSDITVLKSNISRLQDIKVFHSNRQTGSNKCAVNNGGCAQLCLHRGNDTVTCACSHGKLAEDGMNCEEYESFLLYSKVTSVESIHLFDNSTSLNAPKESIKPKKPSDISDMQNVIGLTYDFDSKRLFYSDIQRGNLYSVYFNNTGYNVVYAGVGSVEGLAYDSKNQRLFFTSFTNSSINLLDFSRQSTIKEDSKKIKIIVQLGIDDHPRAIVINPCIQRIFWTNWNPTQPSIQTSFYDGEKAESIVTENIRTPNGLAIDYKARKLYWSDARLDKIERINYDGSDRMVIVKSVTQHSFSLAVHGDYLYWTDWLLRAVLRANKYDGSGITLLRNKLERQPMGIVAVDQEYSKCEADPCYRNAFGCDHFCSVNAAGEPSCSCSENFKLLSDGKRCIYKSVTVACTEDHFVCWDKTDCIPFNQTCDGIPHCKDASDESIVYCSSRQCPVSYFQCSGQLYNLEAHFCIEKNRVCDDTMDCDNGIDEENCPCKDDEFQCVSDGLCISNKLKCDYDSDCIDHSDEMHCDFNCSKLEISGVKHEGLISCNTTSMCIYPSWICDHSNDCWDNSDEKNCNYTEDACPEGAFKCKDDGTCILQRWRCDKDADCLDRSDELGCSYRCDDDQMQCDDGAMCIPKTWKCDGHGDCHDKSDEKDCENVTCNIETHFKCKSGQCIPKQWRCDKEFDCSDRSDEHEDIGCEQMKCAWDEFRCLNQHCIKMDHYCDGDDDCGDRSDEPDTCVYDSCSSEEFQCNKSRKCIAKADQCNGHSDCLDNSDEVNCTLSSPCGGPDLFQCTGGSCINRTLVCNDETDCEDGSDESRYCGINECKIGNGRCSHNCIDEQIGFRCTCPSGYKLKSDNRTCTDINECLTEYPCSQICQNSKGSFRCKCADGYALERDQTSCKSTQPPRPRLLVANRYFIYLINITTGWLQEILSNSTNAVAVDFDWLEQYIYWSDITFTSSSINRKRLNDSAAKTEVLHSATVRNPDGLAVDWVGRNLYWCDKTTDTIEVSRLDGSNRLVLVKEGLQEPRALEVFPQKGLLFYTDWGDLPHIGRVHMDGTHQQVIVQDNLAWPNALTIDYETSTIFWADGNLDYIGMVRINGTGRRTVIGHSFKVPHVFAMTTFESHLYWTDWEKDAILYADKFSGSNTRILTNLTHRPMDIQVLHPLRQVTVLDAWNQPPCDIGCTHLCLLRPNKMGTEIVSVIGQCACPENFYLSHDGISCISNCTGSQFKCGDESKCIPHWWECDGRQDCLDKSDEHENCGDYYCPQPGMFQCKNDSSHQCLFPYQICDGIPQCVKGSDESECESYFCLEHYFKCTGENKCIPDLKKCDGIKDCSENDDESTCGNATCKPDQFKCENNRCIPYVWRCDSDNDCGDNSDEPSNCHNQTCKPGHFKCNISGQCIPEAWKCDGDNDCGDKDNSDEDSLECHLKTCDPTYFKCDNGHCIPGRWKCDYHDDCKDGSDERGCPRQDCTNLFTCANMRCFPNSIVCDGNDNCGDHSDEVNCNVTCNPSSEFMCNNTNHCIPKAWKCDEDSDCSDGSDEWGCQRTCGADEFQCNNSICHPLLWRCDGDHDCGDGSDEDPAMCAQFFCAPGRFRCLDHICIWNSMVCDGNKDCKQGEDEDLLICPDKCAYPKFACLGSSLCLTPGKVCDGNWDCAFSNSSDKSDEDHRFCNLTRGWSCDNHTTNNCEHYCHQYENGIRCSCADGYELSDNGYSCIEVNPCEILGTCSQLCTFNSTGERVHSCSCEEGFRQHYEQCFLNISREEDWPTMLIAEERQVMKTELKTDEALFLRNTSVQSVVRQYIIAMDMDVAEKIVFIITHANNSWQINKHIIGTSSENRHRRQSVDEITLISQSSREIRDLAVDWVSRRLYLTDATERVISIMDYDGKRQKRIVVDNVHSPQAVAVDAVNSKLYWTDRGQRPSISQSNLDGSNRTVLVKSNVVWPIDLAVDIPNQRLYWVDSKLHSMETITTGGKDRRVLARFTGPPTSVDVFGDVVYVVQEGTLYQMTKYRIGTPGIIYKTKELPHDILISHKLKQKNVSSACAENSKHDCVSTQVCFNLPGGNTSCLCPDNSRLEDGKCQFIKCHCLNGGTCGEGTSKCKCRTGYSGTNCENWACRDYCHNMGSCHVSKDGKPKCTCLPAFTGEQCATSLLGNCSSNYCYNNGICKVDPSGYLHCHCPLGFSGHRCQDCDNLRCFNEGWCTVHHHFLKRCNCLEGFDPATNCAVNCETFCKKDGGFYKQYVYSGEGTCNCNCPPSYTEQECNRKCEGFCMNEGSCKLDENHDPVCVCPRMFFEGKKCEICKCQPGGECVANEANVVTKCQCYSNYTGDLCQTLLTSERAQDPSLSVSETIMLSVGIAIVITVIAVIITLLYFRNRRRQEQYHHKRMQDGGELNVTNPVYMRKDPGDDDDEDDEEEPLGASLIYTGNASPMYDAYNATGSESTQMLLATGNTNEERELLDNSMTVRYFGSHEGSDSQKYSVA